MAEKRSSAKKEVMEGEKGAETRLNKSQMTARVLSVTGGAACSSLLIFGTRNLNGGVTKGGPLVERRDRHCRPGLPITYGCYGQGVSEGLVVLKSQVRLSAESSRPTEPEASGAFPPGAPASQFGRRHAVGHDNAPGRDAEMEMSPMTSTRRRTRPSVRDRRY